jgi:hypothetical protein
MKLLLFSLMPILFYQSCDTKKEQSDGLKSFLSKCDELNIVYYIKDTFVFKTTDTSTIRNFTELISADNDTELPSSNSTAEEQLIYKSKGQIFFTAHVFNHYEPKGIRSDYVSYVLHAKMCKHLLTYSTGMAIDEIYEHKINPKDNPWTTADTAKYIYEGQ